MGYKCIAKSAKRKRVKGNEFWVSVLKRKKEMM